MENRFRNRAGRAFSAALLAGALGACDFIEPTTADPNNVADASVDQIFTGTQVNLFYLSQSIYARIASMWTQQTAGATSQFTGLDQYKIGEDDFDDEFASHYTGGGLIDIRKAIAAAEEDGRRTYAGILKVHEAWYVGTAADIYGDIPYSEAVNEDIAQPKLDPQLEVYAAVQRKLDEAIADLRSGTGTAAGAVDLNFGGDATCWIQVANSLKARYYMHTAEVNSGAYALALAAAQQGIDRNSCNWRAIHSSASTETNIWHQFTRDRPDHIVGGFFLINLLNNGTPANTADDDPRLARYFQPARGSVAGQYIGSKPGSPAGDVDEIASPFNTTSNGVVAADYNQPIVSCWETQFIIAEAQFRAGDQAAARDAANRALACQNGWFGITLRDIPATTTGNALLEEILKQKYIAQFLNIDAWADYQRTCYPRIPTFEGQEVPGRALYGTTERQTNPNIPSVGAQRQKPRNANDPNPCTSA